MLENARGSQAWFVSRGATLARVRGAGRDGRLHELALGLAEPSAYDGDHPYLGSIVGRCAGRIGRGRFELDGRTHALPCNDGAHQLHGGPDGFARRLWDVERDGPALCFRLSSPDGDQGHPGRLDVEARYTLRDDDALVLELHASCDRPTVASLASHVYWNLADGGASSTEAHELWLAADEYVAIDREGIPSGELRPVRGSPLDFTAPTPLGARRAALAARDGRGGYDHPFALRGSGLRRAARLVDPASGRALELDTTQPCLVLYGGNFLDGSLVGFDGARFGRRHGVCLEAQGFPDAPNHASFPSIRLAPGEDYAHTTVWRFSLP